MIAARLCCYLIIYHKITLKHLGDSMVPITETACLLMEHYIFETKNQLVEVSVLV